MDSAFTADQEAEVEVQGHRRRRKRRQIDWDKPRQIRHAHDLSDEEKVCSCCGRTMDRIGEDVTRELELEPASEPLNLAPAAFAAACAGSLSCRMPLTDDAEYRPVALVCHAGVYPGRCVG